MADVTSIHDILEKPGYTYEQIRTLLRRDSSSINQVLGGKAPLHRVLKGPSHGPASIVKTPVGIRRQPKFARLQTAQPAADDSGAKGQTGGGRSGLIEMLIQAGADFNVDTSYRERPVYSAFQYKDKDDVERMKALLDSSGVDLKIRNPWKSHCSARVNHWGVRASPGLHRVSVGQRTGCGCSG
ncbi:hypothetical protein JTE90_025894 [Oedothorax gibbosus]|uniref:Uncharacterized protein n=1 Tax=Oedothorax gibbosus TaxID=931172 RepID=A0AAV6TJ75_9ARAC|nr:hypothetical protein JTE90_025894 [Oedothorax gibbosus]